MYYRLGADFIVILHLGFVCFVVAGGLLALKWRRVAWLHVPAVVWGALVEFQGWFCPLTPLEQQLRQAGGQPGYSGGFVERYLMPVLYPAGLDREVQMVLGTAVVVINLAVYAWLVMRSRRRGDNN
jgi:hypothetical protein